MSATLRSLLIAPSLLTAAMAAPSVDWPNYLGDKHNSHHSALDQINAENVSKLRVAWTYHSGEENGAKAQIQCNPLVIGGVLYGTSPDVRLFALDAATGRQLWRFDPGAGNEGGLAVNRGVASWTDGTERRILFSAGKFLHAVDAATGKAIPSFGEGGRVDLTNGLGREAGNLYLVSTTPGIVYQDLLILGSRVSEGPGPAAPGHIRAFDVRSGRIVWTFHTIPQPGEPGIETWPPDAWKYIGGANCWAGMALDEKRGLVFAPTGSAAFDFWGGNRIGQNLYANCLLALDAATGKRVWHYQLVHHDIWDRDPPASPVLLTVKRDGKSVDAVAQTTKQGRVFVFNRETGEPLFPIDERPVPPSDMPGEAAWPTQPLPRKPAPFARQLFTETEITDISPEAHKAVLERFVKVRPHALFMPPSMQGTIIFPGFDGGAEWGGPAVDPDTGILYVNANEMPWILTMTETRSQNGPPLATGEAIYQQLCAACHGVNRSGDPARAFPSLEKIREKLKREDVVRQITTGKGMMPSFAFLTDTQRESLAAYLLGEPEPAGRGGTPPAAGGDALGRDPFSTTGYNRWLDPNGYPAVKPPWGTLTAIDLNSGEFVWQTTLGELPELTAKGIPPTGTENYGGPVLTAGGLLFIGASKDEMFRAFDRKTGKVLWQTKLPAGAYATPATYMVNGKQYVVVACGGGKMGTPAGDAYVAFALPE